jgi:hypothetical protein
MQGANGTTRDEYVNTFWLETDHDPRVATGSGGTWGDAIALAIDQMWTNVDSESHSLIQYMSARWAGQSVTKFYAASSLIGDATAHLGPPIYIADTGPVLAPPDELGLPEECSACLSYNVVPSGVRPGRARGRIYIGPLNVHAMDELADHDQPTHINGVLQALMLLQGASLMASLAAASVTWCLFSRANAAAYPITNFSVDNAFDTIRNRGSAPSLRISS